MTTAVKICGITSVADARLADDSGADFIGIIVDIQGSPRSVSPSIAERIICSSNGRCVVLLEKPYRRIIDIADALRPHAVQLVGTCPPDDLARLRQELCCDLWATARIPPCGASEFPDEKVHAAVSSCCTAGCDTIVLDTLVRGSKGGTGRVCDWDAAAGIVTRCPKPVFLAGGLSPDNAAEAVARVAPAGIDVSSGVEKQPGVKDPSKVRAIVKAVK